MTVGIPTNDTGGLQEVAAQLAQAEQCLPLGEPIVQDAAPEYPFPAPVGASAYEISPKEEPC